MYRGKDRSLMEVWNKGPQRTRKLCMGNVPCMLEKCEGRFVALSDHGENHQRESPVR